jgi:HAMP domain-containing protein
MTFSSLKTKITLIFIAIFAIIFYGQKTENEFAQTNNTDIHHVTQLIIPINNDLHKLLRAFENQFEHYERAVFSSDNEPLDEAALKATTVQNALIRLSQKVISIEHLESHHIESIQKRHRQYTFQANRIYTSYILSHVDDLPVDEAYELGQLYQKIHADLSQLLNLFQGHINRSLRQLEWTIVKREQHSYFSIALRVLLLMLLGLAIYYLIFKRLNTLTTTCQNLSKDLYHPIPDLGSDELGQLTHAIEELKRSNLKTQEQLLEQLRQSKNQIEIMNQERQSWVKKVSLYLTPTLFKSIFESSEKKE